MKIAQTAVSAVDDGSLQVTLSLLFKVFVTRHSSDISVLGVHRCLLYSTMNTHIHKRKYIKLYTLFHIGLYANT